MVTTRLTGMFSDFSIPGERQGAQSAHRMTDQDDRSGIVTEIADGLIRDQPANGEFVDVSPDAGFFEALGQAVHPARKDRAERAAEQVDARLRLGRGWRRVGRRPSRQHWSCGRPDRRPPDCNRSTGCRRKGLHGSPRPQPASDFSCTFRSRFWRKARRTLKPAGHAIRRSADDLSSRNWQNLRHSSLRRRR